MRLVRHETPFSPSCTLTDLVISCSSLLAHMMVMNTHSFCDAFDINAVSRAVLLSHYICILFVDTSISIVAFDQAKHSYYM